MDFNNEASLTLPERIKLMSKYRNACAGLFRGALPSVDFSKENGSTLFLHIILFLFLMFIFIPFLGIWFFLPYAIIYVLRLIFKLKSSLNEQMDIDKQALQEFCIVYKPMLSLIIPYMQENHKLTIIDSKELSKSQSNQYIQTQNNVLWLGYSTGELSQLWHKAGLAANQHICLSLEDACKNILVLGGIGSGKTTSVMQPLLAQALEQDWGGLIFDIKGDVKQSAQTIAASFDNKQLIVIGPNNQHLNLLSGLTPEVAASFLKSTFLLSGHSMDSFWIDTATELCRNCLGLLSLTPKHYTLQGLYEYLFEPDAKQIIDGELFALEKELEPDEKRKLNGYRRYLENIFAEFDAKVKSNVKATVSQVLSPFNHPELLDSFCSSDNYSLNMEQLLDGKVYLVDMPLSTWGLGGKVVYTFIKLRFFNLMQSRITKPELNQERPVLFMCDEYQEIVSANKDGLSDLNFWDKSRSSKTIGIISSQSISSFYAALNNEHATNALLQNFRQRIFLKTEDQPTLTFASSTAGSAITRKLQISKNYNQQGTAAPPHGNSKTPHTNENIVESRELVIDAQLFRSLNPMQGLAFLTINRHSLDDVIDLLPVFTNPN